MPDARFGVSIFVRRKINFFPYGINYALKSVIKSNYLKLYKKKQFLI